MMKRIIRRLAIVMNVCLLGLTAIMLASMAGDYNMEWAQMRMALP